MKKECYGVTIDLERDDLLTDFSRNLLRDYYMNEDEKSPQESFARAAVAFSSDSSSDGTILTLLSSLRAVGISCVWYFRSPESWSSSCATRS